MAMWHGSRGREMKHRALLVLVGCRHGKMSQMRPTDESWRQWGCIL